MIKCTLEHEAVQLCGLPWYEQNGQRFWRLPNEIEDQISKALWENSRKTSGGRIRFRSNTTSLGLLVDYGDIGSESSGSGRIARMGLDVYADGRYWNSISPQTNGINEALFFEHAERNWRDFTIYLPLHHEVSIKKILLDDDAEIVPPSPFSATKPVIFYGTSITQGGSASRPGLSYPAQLSRKLNFDFINYGFSGLGKGDLPVARTMAKLEASCYVLDFAQNNANVEELGSVYLPFIKEIRKTKTDTPLLLTTPIAYTAENWSERFREEQERKREVIRNAYQTRIKEGDHTIHIIEGYELLSVEDSDGQMDGAHPNDIGFQKMCSALLNPLQSILDLE